MPTPLPRTARPIVFDTLPAIKVRHYTGTGRVYCYGRAYLLGDTLHLSLTAFEREPAATSRVGFGVETAAGTHFVWLSPEESGMGGVPQGCPPAEAEALAGQPLPEPPSRFAGEDEQGWYWGAALRIPCGLLGLAGREGEELGAAVFKYEAGEAGFGASCPCKEMAGLERFGITNQL